MSAESDFTDSATVYVQSLALKPAPVVQLAEIQFNPSTLSASITSYESPELSSESRLVRLGVYDPTTASWRSSTTLASSENFAKGYSPTFVITLNTQGAVLGVSLSSSKIDAGQTRDFGPKIKLVKTANGKSPDLNRPVVLSSEGKLEEPEPEKTLLQK